NRSFLPTETNPKTNRTAAPCRVAGQRIVAVAKSKSRPRGRLLQILSGFSAALSTRGAGAPGRAGAAFHGRTGKGLPTRQVGENRGKRFAAGARLLPPSPSIR